jgi:hypothetical protein
MISVVMLIAIMVIVGMLNVVAPKHQPECLRANCPRTGGDPSLTDRRWPPVNVIKLLLVVTDTPASKLERLPLESFHSQV